MVISPERKNPKKHSVAAAHSIRMSGSAALGAQCVWILLRIAGVIGSLIFDASGVCWE